MKMTLKHFIYEDHIQPNGLLPRSHYRQASAAWHFAKLAMRAIEKVTEQATPEGRTDQTINLRQLAESTATLYGISDLTDMIKFMPIVRREALACGLFWNSRFQAWLDSGGKAYDEVTREPDKLNRQ